MTDFPSSRPTAKRLLLQWTIAMAIGTCGVIMMVPQLNWQTLFGMALVMWGNNLSLAKFHD